MSEILTSIRLRGVFGAGWMNWGRFTRERMIADIKKHAAADKERAEAILAASDDAFDVKIVRGAHVQHLVKQL